MKTNITRTCLAGGFTLSELITVMGIITILLLVAFANHRRQFPCYQLDKAAMQMAVDLRTAKMRAVSENIPVEVDISCSDLKYTIESDSNTNGTIEASEQQVIDLSCLNNLVMESNVSQGTFIPSGLFTTSNGNCEVQLKLESVGTRRVHILTNGQVIWQKK